MLSSFNQIHQPMGPNEISKEFINGQDNISFNYNVFTYDYTGYDEFKYELIIEPIPIK